MKYIFLVIIALIFCKMEIIFFIGKGVAACEKPVHTLIKKYQEFCQIFSLKQFVNMQHLFSN